MNNFFLLNEAIDLNDYKQFKEGVSELMIIEKKTMTTSLNIIPFGRPQLSQIIYFPPVGKKKMPLSFYRTNKNNRWIFK